jgi:hypothetical protein
MRLYFCKIFVAEWVLANIATGFTSEQYTALIVRADYVDQFQAAASHDIRG